MKKLVSICLMFAMCISLTACGGGVKEEPAKVEMPDAETSSETGEKSGEAETEAASAWEPTQEIRIIVCYKAGGQSDLFARKLAAIIEENKFLDTSFVVVNMAEGNTNDGINALKEADADGHTLMFHHNAFITLNTTGAINTSYEDVEFVCEALEQPFLIVANADSKYESAQDIIDDVKAGNTVPIGYSGFASPGHFALLNFLYQADIVDGIQQVTYTGGSEAITAQLGGQIDLRSSNTGDSFSYIASGDIKPLVFMSDERHASYPDVETTADMGYGEAITLRSGLFAPQGTPKEIITAIAQAVEKACQTEEWQEFCLEQGAANTYADGETFKEKFDADKEAIDTLVEVFGEQFGK